MKRPLPFWVAAVVPATLAGHGIAYALSGRSISDGHHAWLIPVLDCSLALLGALAVLYAGDALLRAKILTHTLAERSFVALWQRLAVSQLVLFAVMERAEGGHAGIAGMIVQVVVALVVAYALSLFTNVLKACACYAEQMTRYLTRSLLPLVSFVSLRPLPMAHALAVRAGSARFQRPPPQT